MIDALLTNAFGILINLTSFGKIDVSKDRLRNQEYLNGDGMVLRVGGIVLIAVGCSLADEFEARRAHW
jgi:hypothetical protein